MKIQLPRAIHARLGRQQRKGSGTKSRNGPWGASYFWFLARFSILVGHVILTTAHAKDFVVETQVRDLADDRSVEIVVTVFTGSIAVDYLATQPQDVTVFDFGRQCAWRLDPATKTKQWLSFDLLARLTEEATLRAVRLPPEVQFAAQPDFESRRWNPENQRLRLEHDLLTYEAKLDVSADPDQVARFRAFADWSARLNTLRPGLPPTARLELNREIAIRDAVPVQVRVRRKLPSGITQSLVADHHFRTELTPGERRQMNQVSQRLAEYAEQPWQP